MRAWAYAGARELWRIRLTLLALAFSVGVGIVAHLLVARPNGDGLRVAVIFVALAAVPLAFRPSRAVFVTGALVAAWLLAVAGIQQLPHVINPEPSVSGAVGAAAFFNTPYRGPQIGALLSVAIPALVALASAWRTRRHESAALEIRVPAKDVVGPSPAGSVAAATSSAARIRLAVPSWRLLGLALGTALLALTLVPDLRAGADAAGSPLPYSWDGSNAVAWQGFVQLGMRPMKDFFFPYGFQWLFTLRNVGALLQWFSQVAMLAIAGWSLWRLTGGRTWRVLLCLLAVILASMWSGAVFRYFPALLIVTTYAALGPARHARLTRGHLLFAATCLLAVFLEPDLLLIGVLGAIMVAVGELVGGRVVWQPRTLVRCLAIDAIPVVGAAVLIVLVWVISGTTTGNLHFFGEFTVVSAQSASDEKLFGPLGLMALHPNAYALVGAVPAMLAVAGLLWARLRRGSEAAVAAVLLGASGVALGLVLKHLVRQITDEILIVPLVALAWVAILIWKRDSFMRAAAAGAAAGALLTLANDHGGVTNYFSTVTDAPNHAVRSVSFLTDYSARVRAGKQRFDAVRFTGWPDATAVGLYSESVPTRPLPPFAVVGDLQMMYVLLRQPPPYQINLYDAGRLDEQRTMVGLLRRRQPPYVIWRRDYVQDGFPYNVRDPLVFTWMVGNYVPVREFQIGSGPATQGTSAAQPLLIDILKRRAPGAAPAISYWASRLGLGLDLGFVPSLSAAAGAPTCSGGSGCVAYAVLHGTPFRTRAPLGFTIKSGRITYSVTFLAREGVTDYPVRLDRLWFWPLLAANPTFASVTPGFSVKHVSLRTGDNLY